MHTPFHDVLRYYPDPVDPIIITMTAGVDGEQHICGHTRAGMELGPEVTTRESGNSMDDIQALPCFERTSGRERRLWAPAKLVELPDDAASWGLSVVAFHIDKGCNLKQHHVLVRLCDDGCAVDWRVRTLLYADGESECRCIRESSRDADTMAHLREVVSELYDVAMSDSPQGVIAESLAGIVDYDDKTLAQVLQVSRPRGRGRASTRVRGSGLLAF